MGQTLSQQTTQTTYTKEESFLVLELGFLTNKTNSITFCRKTPTFLPRFAKTRLFLDKKYYLLVLSLQKLFKTDKIVE